jgi:hypothetical protein
MGEIVSWLESGVAAQRARNENPVEINDEMARRNDGRVGMSE